MTYTFFKRFHELVKERSSQLDADVNTVKELVILLPKLKNIDNQLLELEARCEIVNISQHHDLIKNFLSNEIKIIDGLTRTSHLIEDSKVQEVIAFLKRITGELSNLFWYIAGRNSMECKIRIAAALNKNDLDFAQYLAAIGLTGKRLNPEEKNSIKQFIEHIQKKRIEEALSWLQNQTIFSEGDAGSLRIELEKRRTQKIEIEIISPKPNTKIQNGSTISLIGRLMPESAVKDTDFEWWIEQ